MKLWHKILAAGAALALIAGIAIETDAQSGWYDRAKGGLTRGSLIYARSSAQLGAIDASAAGKVLASAGTGTAPAWSASPTLTGVTLSGATASTVICVDSNKLTTSTCTGASPSITGLTLSGVLTGGAGSNIAINTDKFTVAAATGNTVVAGTLGVTGVATLTAAPVLSSTTASTVVCVDGSKAVTSTCTGASPAVTAITTTGTATFGDADADTHVSRGSWTGHRSLALVHTSGNLILTHAHCGRTIINNATTGTQTFTLPAVADVPGCQIAFVTGHADGETLVNMAASGTCVITTFTAVGADADTAIVSDASCDTGLKNTGASNAIGDSLVLVSDGTRWLGVGITAGIWASQ